MQLTPKQQEVVDAAMRWLEVPVEDDAEFVLAGYAGTGKTTLLRAIVEARPDIECAAPTGKAAGVLRGKLRAAGGDLEAKEVKTLHSLLYLPQEVDEATMVRAAKFLEWAKAQTEDPEQARIAELRLAKLEKMRERGECEFMFNGRQAVAVIVDEASMVDERLERDLRRTGAKLLFVGDPGQLPPVEGRSFFERNRPDAVLDQVHRQAAESPVLMLATSIRLGEQFQGWNEACSYHPRGMPGAQLCEFGKVITGRNDTRRALNERMRAHLGFSGALPMKGEELICLRNSKDLQLVNGEPAHVLRAPEQLAYGMFRAELAYGGQARELVLDDFAFRLYSDPAAKRVGRADAPQFDFGHCITAHKAQGSEWPAVAVWDDGLFYGRGEDRRRWAYTAVTRASERLAWICGR